MLDTIWSSIVAAKASIFTGAVVAALCLPTGYCKGYEAARDKAEAERATANVTAITTARTADEAAAVQRVDDVLDIAKQEEELTDAVQSTPDEAPDAVRVALGCARLREAGTSTIHIPACNGRESAH